MNAKQYLNEALRGNLNISTLTPLAWHEIMEGYARYKLVESQKSTTKCNHDFKWPAVSKVSICKKCGYRMCFVERW